MTETLTPRWREADEAVESLVATLVAAATQSADHNARKRPRGRARTKGRPKSTRRHIAEVIRRHRLAPGLRVDRDMVAALLIGHRELVTDPVLVVAVAQACGIIGGHKLSAKKAARLRAASVRAGKLIARAEAVGHVGAESSVVPAPRAAPTASAPVPVGNALRPSAARPPAPRRSHVRRWWLAAAALVLVAVVLLGLD